ncbi:MAG: Maf family protein [Syntrophomonas sp.]|uniref:Maf family protein n=1 Tax=Syntrophomonas sp. TaxID=2053627 RepID=UPI0026299E17|nr:Maf family protein [Syntrophomonas sp.]MDD2510171.1 Maf family protein [Syntrophomonas sp.]MDD3879487.1 Maf family protein [Syntrophomonas sp.]MDD4625778.1 Maf family protein [Syntrophomonas sp.]
MHKGIILASASPRRQDLLDALGVKYKAVPAKVEEQFFPGELPRKTAERIAREKAEAVARDFDNGLVLAADTIVVCDGKLLGKPHDEDDAFHKLSCLSGKSHEVITAVCLQNIDKAESEVASEVTRVYFRSLSAAEIKAYIASGEAMDKAGAYGIQGLGSVFVERIDGCYFNVVGLPVSRVYEMLARQGINILEE